MALGLTPYQIIEKGTHPQLVIAEDWDRIELKYIATVQNGYAFSSKLFNRSEGLPLIRIRDIFSSETQNLYSGEYKDDFIVRKGDVLIGMDGDFKVSKWPGEKGLLNQRVCRILFKSNYYEKDFLFLCIQPYLDAIHSETSAVTVKHLSSRTINNIPFPLPPLPIQKAIVTKTDQLFSSLDSGIADLKKAQEQLKIYRQAVLKKAFEGELTKEWREKQTNLPTADELLKQIKEERQNHYNQQIETWKKAVKDWEEKGKVGKKPSKPKKLKELPPLIEKLKDIPIQWRTVTLEHIGYWTGGGTPSKSNKEFWSNGNILWITSKDMKSKNIINTQDKITEASVLLSSAKMIKKDSVLFVLRSGILRRILPIAINKIDCTINQDLQALTGFITNPEFIYWYCVSNEFDIRHKCAKSGTTVESVESSLLKGYLFPLCSKEEQTQIVRQIESRLSVCDKVEQSIVESLEKAKALRQSILKKAFDGKLLSAAEIAECKKAKDYEPASVLLERIKAEKLENAKAKKKKR